jgi:mannose-6-phosphate isomerase-like protein (cupin superfamily)
MSTVRPEARYLLLRRSGDIENLEGGAAFWALPPAQLDRLGQDWLVSEYCFNEHWSSWERHPNGDEVVYLLDGALDLVLQRDGHEEVVELRGRGAAIIPRGTWHTARVHAPSQTLFMTLGHGTEHRPLITEEST